MKSKAFSLMEIILVIALVGIIGAINAPSLLSFKQAYEFTNSTELFDASLERGFSESRAHSKNISIHAQKGDTSFVFDGTEIPLVGSTAFEKDFEITFLSPLGDIKKSSSKKIFLSSTKKRAAFIVYTESGLIDLHTTKKIPGKKYPDAFFEKYEISQ